jgi:ABC-2 type transport system permease protein
MNTHSNAMPGAVRDAQMNGSQAVAISEAQRLYWSVRRELWEYRSLYIAPLVVAAVVLSVFLIASIGRALSTASLAERRAVLEEPLNFAMGLIMATTVIVGVFYCLETLQSERRDRSILFWKSLPVSDLTIVLSKASIPLLVLPLITFVVTIATQWIMLLLSSLVLLGSGESAVPLWAHASLPQTWLMLLYHLLAIHALWYAPFWCWLLLISAWARRAAFLWAALPPLVIGVVEKLAFHTKHFTNLLCNRLSGSVAGGDFFASAASMDPMMHLTPGKFLASPGLWIGLAFSAAFLFAAVRLRRSHGPI